MVEESKSPIRQTLDDQLISAIQKGSIDDIKKLINQGVDLNHKDRNGSTAIYSCSNDEQLNIARFLLSQGSALNISNIRGNTPLHIAVERGSKEIILLFMLNNADPSAVNANGQKPEDLNQEMKPLLWAINKDRDSYRLLNENQRKRLNQIFDDIDGDGTGQLDIAKSTKFNRFLEDDLPEDAARKDASDFIRDVSICKPGKVNLDEWLFSFSKLAAEMGSESIDQFIEDYERRIKEKGKFADFRVRD
ncbi:unnamed protein product [Blepharisma stoltei]|uniref:Uncharacterized protein n=1 Tax=Blepharisma stoltei TaxID=1481888 RepID=A0AAU9JDZ9_9CILI|nr:unnamed protein product [Blepharisma stoltei]